MQKGEEKRRFINASQKYSLNKCESRLQFTNINFVMLLLLYRYDFVLFALILSLI